MITLENVLSNVEAHRKLGIQTAGDVKVFFDTSAIKHLKDIEDVASFRRTSLGGDYKFVVSLGALRQLDKQMEKNSESFPQLLHLQVALLHPEITKQFVLPEDESAILLASERTSYGRREYGDNHPGWTDTNYLGGMMERARKGRNTALITDDEHLRAMVYFIRKEEPYKSHMIAASILRCRNALHNGRTIPAAA